MIFMRKKCLMWLVAALLPNTLFGKGEVVYTRLQSLYSNNAGGWNIEKVVLFRYGYGGAFFRKFQTLFLDSNGFEHLFE